MVFWLYALFEPWFYNLLILLNIDDLSNLVVALMIGIQGRALILRAQVSRE